MLPVVQQSRHSVGFCR